jgi:colicin import membrane protein
MHQKFTLAILIIGGTAVAKGQTTRRDSLPTKGKENLSIYDQGHVYDILTVDDKMVSLQVDNKRIEPADFHRYDSVLHAIKSDMREDEAHEAEDREEERRDREQEKRDREQEMRDREQAVRDREQERQQAQRDREQEIRDREQEKKEREQEKIERQQEQQQAQREREQGERDREQGLHDREQGQRDREQGERDRKEAEEERRLMREFLDDLVTEKVTPDVKSINSMTLTETELIVNDKKQSPELQQKMKAKYGKWAKRGLSYGCYADGGTTIHFSN